MSCAYCNLSHALLFAGKVKALLRFKKADPIWAGFILFSYYNRRFFFF